MNAATTNHENLPPWRIHLFGVLRVETTRGEGQPISRFRTRTTGSLLAYLAFYIGDARPREVAIDAIWPETNFSSGRNRFFHALKSLRQQFATATVPPGDVFALDALSIALNSAHFVTDVGEFEAALRRARRVRDAAERLVALDAALALYRADLLTGYYEDWIEAERSRLRVAFERATAERDQINGGFLLPGRSPLSPAASETDIPTRLTTVPTYPTNFYGRSGEVARLTELLATSAQSSGNTGSPLITLTGIGGIGKSRLAAECAHRVAAAYAGRVWFVELADKTESSQIWTALRAALGLETSSASDVPAQIAAFLALTPALLILDNLEQFVGTGAATAFVNELRACLPQTTLLATSRHILGAYGEKIFPVRSLLSRSEWALAPSTAQDTSACIDLFSDRARIANPGFTATHLVLSDLFAISAQLEGIPLALELAAARCNLLTPKQLLRQLSDRFTLLHSTRRDVASRHSSLFTAVATSVDLLPDPLQRVFRSLSVFRGGWTIAAIQTVCQISEAVAWDAMSELCDRSLVQPVAPVEGRSELDPRFRLLETLRDFAAQALQRNGEADAAMQRHQMFYFALAKQCESDLATGGEPARLCLDALEADHANLRAALNSPISYSDERLRVAVSLHGFWLRRGFAEEGKGRLQQFLDATPTVVPALHATAHNALGRLSWATGSLSEALAHFNEALPYFESGADPRRVAGLLNNIGIVSEQNGSIEAARQSYAHSLSLFTMLGDDKARSRVMTNLGAVLINQDALTEADALLSEGLSLQRASGDNLDVMQTLQSIGEVALRQGHMEKAASALRESWAIRQQFEERSTLWDPLMTTARLLVERGNVRKGCVLFGAAKGALRANGPTATLPVTMAEERTLEQCLRFQVGQLTEYETLCRVGSEMVIDDVMAFALQALDATAADQV